MTIITIAQQKGGAGKTTIAAHLAVALSQNLNVAIIDIDPQASLTAWYKQRVNKLGIKTNLHFSNISGNKLQIDLSRLQNKYDIIIIDSPPHIEAEARNAIKFADLVIAPVQPSPTDLWAIEPTLQLAKDEHTNIYILLNRVPHNSKFAKQISSLLPNLLTTTLGNRIAYATSLIDGQCVTETEPTSLAAKEVTALAEEIRQLVKDHIKSKKKELIS